MNPNQTTNTNNKPVIIITKTIGERNAKVRIENYTVSLKPEIQSNNQEVLEKEVDYALQCARQLNLKTDSEEDGN